MKSSIKVLALAVVMMVLGAGTSFRASIAQAKEVQAKLAKEARERLRAIEQEKRLQQKVIETHGNVGFFTPSSYGNNRAIKVEVEGARQRALRKELTRINTSSATKWSSLAEYKANELKEALYSGETNIPFEQHRDKAINKGLFLDTGSAVLVPVVNQHGVITSVDVHAYAPTIGVEGKLERNFDKTIPEINPKTKRDNLNVRIAQDFMTTIPLLENEKEMAEVKARAAYNAFQQAQGFAQEAKQKASEGRSSWFSKPSITEQAELDAAAANAQAIATLREQAYRNEKHLADVARLEREQKVAEFSGQAAEEKLNKTTAKFFSESKAKHDTTYTTLKNAHEKTAQITQEEIKLRQELRNSDLVEEAAKKVTTLNAYLEATEKYKRQLEQEITALKKEEKSAWFGQEKIQKKIDALNTKLGTAVEKINTVTNALAKAQTEEAEKQLTLTGESAPPQEKNSRPNTPVFNISRNTSSSPVPGI